MRLTRVPRSSGRKFFIASALDFSWSRYVGHPKEAKFSIETRRHRWLNKVHPRAVIVMDDVRFVTWPVVHRKDPPERDVYVGSRPGCGCTVAVGVISGESKRDIRMLAEWVREGLVIDRTDAERARQLLREGLECSHEGATV